MSLLYSLMMEIAWAKNIEESLLFNKRIDTRKMKKPFALEVISELLPGFPCLTPFQLLNRSTRVVPFSLRDGAVFFHESKEFDISLLANLFFGDGTFPKGSPWKPSLIQLQTVK